MTQKPDKSGKVRVMLMLEPDAAKALRVKVAQAGCRGVSEYITDFVITQQGGRTPFDAVNPDPMPPALAVTPTHVEENEDGTD